MKKIYIILVSAIVLASCGKETKASVESLIANGNSEQLRAKKKDLEAKQKDLSDQLDSINNALSRFDTIKKLPLVSTLLVKEQAFVHHLELQGNVSTKQNVLVYPEMPGILEEVLVKEGQSVKKGQILARINDGGLGEQLAQAKTQEQLAKTTFDRQERLWNQKIGSEMQYLQAKTNYESQKNRVAQIQSQVDKTIVTAPFDGVIDDALKEAGTVVAPGPGSELFRIINLQNMYIEAEVPESYIGAIKKGERVSVYFPILQKTIETTIRQVGNFINPNNRSFQIEIGVPNPNGDIKPNLTARLKIDDYKNPRAILIPQSIISEDANGDQYVYIAANKNANNEAVAKRLVITTGRTQADAIEVLKGVQNGVEIIDEGARSVNNNQTVKIIK